MKQWIGAIAVLLFITTLVPGRAGAENHLTQNEFVTAESLDPGMTQAGVHYTVGEDYFTLAPAFRYGIGSFFEAGLKVGFTNVDVGAEDKLGGIVGGDIKYQLVKETEDVPLDMALDLGFDTTFINGSNLSELTFSVILSKGFPLTERGYKVSPYGGIEMSTVYGSYAPKNDTDVLGFAGVEWKVSQKFILYGEAKLGDDFLGGIGLRFEY
jgi:hypothetical protein